ncbi:SpoIIE family protein phosphatase [Paraconexibacter algicola]|uniref:SpoIIE family protein phosphatase n=1 Tax=Paraconexibacter algicola TaxID=2133960 RepID=UPI0011B1E184|nr:SpoIIE family protein phosphatase [Paraconexibacter algicola]
MAERDAIVLDADPDRRGAVTAELQRHGHAVREVDDLATLLPATVGTPLFVVGVDDDAGVEAVRTIRMTPGGEEAVIVAVQRAADGYLSALLRAGASDVWVLPDRESTIPQVEVRLVLAEHYARLQVEHARVGGELNVLKRALDLSGTGFVLTDPRLPDNPIVYANRSFAEVTGYPLEETLGRNCRFLQGEYRDQPAVAEITEAIREQRSVSVTLRNVRRSGEEFLNEVHIAPVRDDDGTISRFVGVQIDVTEQQNTGARLALEQEARRRAERERRRIAIVAAGTASMDRAESREAVLRALRGAVGDLLGPASVVDLADGEIEQDDRTWVIHDADHPTSSLVLDTTPDDVDDRSAVDLLVERTDEALTRVGRRLAERGLIRAMRESLEPLRPVAIEGLDVDAQVEPAGPGLAVGGDFVDNVVFSDGTSGVVLGDVTGKGPRAAALTGLVRHTVRACARLSASPSQALELVNLMLLDVPDRRRYSALTLGQVLGPADGAGLRVRFALAGSPPPVVLRDGGDARVEGAPGTLLGATDTPTFTDSEVTLGPGEVVAFFSDGVSEPLGGGVQASERLAELLRGVPTGAVDVTAAILRHGNALEGPVTDDRAVIALGPGR